MRRLLPQGVDAAHDAELDGDLGCDLDEAYAWPAAERCLRANMVASVDGAAVLDDVPGTLSGPADRRVFAVLRGLADLILVGAGTVRRENYAGARPTAERQRRRREAGLAEVPPIAVVSRRLELDPAARFFTDVRTRPLVITCAAAPADRQAELASVADVYLAGEDVVDLGSALDQLAGAGFRRVICEGGPRLLADVVAGSHLDELCLTVSPLLVGGRAGRMIDGSELPHPVGLRLLGALAADGALFLRYGRLGSDRPRISAVIGRTAGETPPPGARTRPD